MRSLVGLAVLLVSLAGCTTQESRSYSTPGPCVGDKGGEVRYVELKMSTRREDPDTRDDLVIHVLASKTNLVPRGLVACGNLRVFVTNDGEDVLDETWEMTVHNWDQSDYDGQVKKVVLYASEHPAGWYGVLAEFTPTATGETYWDTDLGRVG